jgi:hypothetical protein
MIEIFDKATHHRYQDSLVKLEVMTNGVVGLD